MDNTSIKSALSFPIAELQSECLLSYIQRKFSYHGDHNLLTGNIVKKIAFLLWQYKCQKHHCGNNCILMCNFCTFQHFSIESDINSVKLLRDNNKCLFCIVVLFFVILSSWGITTCFSMTFKCKRTSSTFHNSKILDSKNQGSIYHESHAKCYTKCENFYWNPKVCIAVFATQKHLISHCKELHKLWELLLKFTSV